MTSSTCVRSKLINISDRVGESVIKYKALCRTMLSSVLINFNHFRDGGFSRMILSRDPNIKISNVDADVINRLKYSIMHCCVAKGG